MRSPTGSTSCDADVRARAPGCRGCESSRDLTHGSWVVCPSSTHRTGIAGNAPEGRQERSSMTELNLQVHGPDEYEGKTVSIGAAEYVIGPRLGGSRKIVHQLVNQRSGLCLHVIKIWGVAGG